MTTLLDTALKLLSARPLSERELTRLLEREFSAHPDLDQAIEATLARLRDLHVLNDHRLAESLSHRYRHKGNRFIRTVLKQKGISDEVIEQTLVECGDEYERALEALHKKLYSVYRTPDDKSKARLYTFLSSRGFSQAVIHQAIKALYEDTL
ncbi:regulatory protein RecX [Legionella feeleii]|uniref:Regulatory protein RecX n=1 Tax=Legionella feeleii TaxID=453 RepID=A0A0W0TEN8_9GAMM|nr:regulatory protein RecX [Legionella feeleii]KTC94051.1 recombination regulator RecX [Legionella feeleii]SPX61991.1 RecX-family regulatory protein [Legionella feeleii]